VTNLTTIPLKTPFSLKDNYIPADGKYFKSDCNIINELLVSSAISWLDEKYA
jgi:hypothetical protein